MCIEIIAVSVFCFVVGLAFGNHSDPNIEDIATAILPALLIALWIYAMLKTRLGKTMSGPIRMAMLTIGISCALLFMCLSPTHTML